MNKKTKVDILTDMAHASRIDTAHSNEWWMNTLREVLNSVGDMTNEVGEPAPQDERSAWCPTCNQGVTVFLSEREQSRITKRVITKRVIEEFIADLPDNNYAKPYWQKILRTVFAWLDKEGE